MEIILMKTTKLALKGSKDKRLVPANGKVIEVTDFNGKLLIENGLATDPSQEIVVASENAEAIQTLEDEIVTLKDTITEKEDEAKLLSEDIENKDTEIVTLKEENQTLKDAANLLGGGAE